MKTFAKKLAQSRIDVASYRRAVVVRDLRRGCGHTHPRDGVLIEWFCLVPGKFNRPGETGRGVLVGGHGDDNGAYVRRVADDAGDYKSSCELAELAPWVW